ncbi:MAG: hypothetical protein U0414_25065 [Polyangiaceae bacterium]
MKTVRISDIDRIPIASPEAQRVVVPDGHLRVVVHQLARVDCPGRRGPRIEVGEVFGDQRGADGVALLERVLGCAEDAAGNGHRCAGQTEQQHPLRPFPDDRTTEIDVDVDLELHNTLPAAAAL